MGRGSSVTFVTEDHPSGQSSVRKSPLMYVSDHGGSITFGRDVRCNVVFRPADLNNDRADQSISRLVGEFVERPNRYGFSDIELWNHSTTNWILVTGERGLSMNVTPRSRALLTQEYSVVWIEGDLANYGFHIVNEIDEELFKRRFADLSLGLEINSSERQRTILAKNAEDLKGKFPPHHQAILEAMFRDYIDPRPGVFPRPRTTVDVHMELHEEDVILKAYGRDADGASAFNVTHVVNVVAGAIDKARRSKVPGFGPHQDEHGRDRNSQSEWNRHRLAMFLLGAGVIDS